MCSAFFWESYYNIDFGEHQKFVFFFLLRRLKSLKSLFFHHYKNALVTKKNTHKILYIILIVWRSLWLENGRRRNHHFPFFWRPFLRHVFHEFRKKYVIPHKRLDLAPLRAWCVWHLFVLYSWFFASSNVMRVPFLLFDWAPLRTLQISITIMFINCFVCDILCQFIGSSSLSCW